MLRLGTAAGIASAVAVSHSCLAPVRAYLAAAQNLEFKIEGAAGQELEQQLVNSLRTEQVAALSTVHTWLTVCFAGDSDCSALTLPILLQKRGTNRLGYRRPVDI